MRIKEQETRLNLHEHDDDDDDVARVRRRYPPHEVDVCVLFNGVVRF